MLNGEERILILLCFNASTRLELIVVLPDPTQFFLFSKSEDRIDSVERVSCVFLTWLTAKVSVLFIFETAVAVRSALKCYGSFILHCSRLLCTKFSLM